MFQMQCLRCIGIRVLVPVRQYLKELFRQAGRGERQEQLRLDIRAVGWSATWYMIVAPS